LYILNPMVPAQYNVDEDWPVDDWGNTDPTGLVCEARFEMIDSAEKLTLLKATDRIWAPVSAPASTVADTATQPPAQPANTFTKSTIPSVLVVRVQKNYANTRAFYLESDQFIEEDKIPLDLAKAEAWANANLPKCVYISEYNFPASRVELNELAQRSNGVAWNTLSQADQTILVVLELAKISINEFIARGQTPDGRTIRSFDKRQASAYLTSQFAKLWGQKKIRFDIDIDATTLNVFVEDEGVGMPVRLDKRSMGFRWYVAFAWKFTSITLIPTRSSPAASRRCRRPPARPPSPR
jgi:hypothetical protein